MAYHIVKAASPVSEGNCTSIPKFSPKVAIHQELVRLSRACHVALGKADDSAVAASEKLINATIEGLWEQRS